eukprot:scaffold2455_cov212-Chaetoceros_neogracile.AAC.42
MNEALSSVELPHYHPRSIALLARRLDNNNEIVGTFEKDLERRFSGKWNEAVELPRYGTIPDQ